MGTPTPIPEDQYEDYPSDEGFDSADGTIGDSPYGSIEYGEGTGGGEPALGGEGFDRVAPNETLTCHFHVGAWFDSYDPTGPDDRTSDVVISKTKLIASGVPVFPVLVVGQRQTRIEPLYTSVSGETVDCKAVAYPGSSIAGKPMVGDPIVQWSDLEDDPTTWTTMGHYRYRLPSSEDGDPDPAGTEDPVDEDGEPTGEDNPIKNCTFTEVQDLEMDTGPLGYPYVKTRHNLMGRPGQILRQGVYASVNVTSRPETVGDVVGGYVWGYYANDDEEFHEIRHNQLSRYKDPSASGFLGCWPLQDGLGVARGTPWRIVMYAYAPTPMYILAEGVVGDVSGSTGTRTWAEIIASGGVGLVGFPAGGLVENFTPEAQPNTFYCQGGGWIVELGTDDGRWPHVWPNGGKFIGPYFEDEPVNDNYDPEQIVE